MRALTLIVTLLVMGTWYGAHRARTGRARRYGREAMERWEAEGGATAAAAEPDGGIGRAVAPGTDHAMMARPTQDTRS